MTYVEMAEPLKTPVVVAGRHLAGRAIHGRAPVRIRGAAQVR